MFVFWSVGLFVGVSMFQDSNRFHRRRLTDKQRKDLERLRHKWEREEREEREAEKRNREKES